MKIRKIDAAIILFFLLIASIFYGIGRYSLNSNYDEKYVIIYSDNTLYKKIAVKNNKLSKTFEIESKYGHNTVKIINGGVLVTKSDCPDQICVKEGFIDKPGQSIICLPHKLVIEIDGIKGEGKGAGIDAVSY